MLCNIKIIIWKQNKKGEIRGVNCCSWCKQTIIKSELNDSQIVTPCMVNEVWNGNKALEYGAVDELVESEELIESAIKVAEKWGSWAESSRRSTKQLIDASTSTFMETQLEFEKLLITNSSLTPDFVEGVSSFLDKRNPNFGEE